MQNVPSISEPAAYRIRILGFVTDGWRDFMHNLEESVLQEDGNSTTVITGIVADQAALFGLLCRIRDSGLVLLGVEYLPDTRSPVTNRGKI